METAYSLGDCDSKPQQHPQVEIKIRIALALIRNFDFDKSNLLLFFD